MKRRMKDGDDDSYYGGDASSDAGPDVYYNDYGAEKGADRAEATSDYDDYYDDYGTEGEAMDAAEEMPAEYYDDYNYS